MQQNASSPSTALAQMPPFFGLMVAVVERYLPDNLESSTG
jgi:hypothetical protein